jgi:predicted dehydrogenase
MIYHRPTSVLFVIDQEDRSLEPFLAYLRPIRHTRLTVRGQLPDDLSPHEVVVTASTAAFLGAADRLTRFVRAGGGWLGLIHLSEEPLPELFGVKPGPLGPAVELRVLFADGNRPMAERLPGVMYLKGRYQALEEVAEDTEIVLAADWRHCRSAVLVERAVGSGRVACTTLQAYGHPLFQQILYRLLRHLGRQLPGKRTLGMGLLGYGEAMGKTHCLGTETTPGLALKAVCDMRPDRRRQAEEDFPGLKTYERAETLASDPDVDLVVIATPPNTHAGLALQIMAAGKHTVCEKPLALNRREADAMAEMADKRGVHLSCHQNRRWDVDYLAIKQTVTDGLIGELFHLETFVGGFGHPCGYWHSHEPVSGGTAYDWGGHYLDWIVSLIPDRVRAVIGTRQKRLWHDITNADQERILIRFAGGQEGEFIHSDIAAARKPKWYLLGTEGAIVGHWREVTSYAIDPVLYYHEHDIPTTEMVPELTMHRRHHSGQIILQKLALPKREPYLFHRNLADHLLTGEPLIATLEQSVQVVAVLEAAARSAAKGGTVEVVHD